MPIRYKNFEDFVNIINAAVKRNIPELDTTIQFKFEKAFKEGMAAACESLNMTLRDIVMVLFPETAPDEFLDRWGNYENLPRPGSTQARGLINVFGTLNTQIPIGTIFNQSNGFQYETAETATIVNNIGSISLLTRSGTLVTCETVTDHGLTSGTLTISGFDQSEYNGEKEITVTDRNVFTFEVEGTPATPGTGTGVYSSEHAVITIFSVLSGDDKNVEKDGAFTLDQEISGVNDGVAQFDGITGGADILSDDDYYSLIFESRSARVGVFTVPQIRIAALSRTGNTRVWVKRPLISGGGGYLDPEPGEVSIFFVRDGDPNIIPTPTIIAETKELIINDGGLSANTPLESVFVQGPDTLSIDFVFSSLSPDTTSMRNAVEANIKAFFQDNVDFEENVTIDSIRGAIDQTVDPETNTALQSFSLSTPTTDQIVTAGQLAIPGTITF